VRDSEGRFIPKSDPIRAAHDGAGARSWTGTLAEAMAPREREPLELGAIVESSADVRRRVADALGSSRPPSAEQRAATEDLRELREMERALAAIVHPPEETPPLSMENALRVAAGGPLSTQEENA
jgi:predicted dehydrogenase